jgi:hypothetical protein
MRLTPTGWLYSTESMPAATVHQRILILSTYHLSASLTCPRYAHAMARRNESRARTPYHTLPSPAKKSPPSPSSIRKSGIVSNLNHVFPPLHTLIESRMYQHILLLYDDGGFSSKCDTVGMVVGTLLVRGCRVVEQL